MRLLVCGGRDCTDQNLVSREILAETSIGGLTVYERGILDGATQVTIIQGGAKGADSCAGVFAAEADLDCDVFPADWKQYGRAAGPIRNAQMLKDGCPDRVLAFWDGKSKGTLSMITLAVKAGLSVRIAPYTKEDST